MAQPNDDYKYPDELTVNGGRVVRLSKISDDTILKIGKHKIRAGDIPTVAARLSCGDTIRGIAFQQGNVVFCEKHHDNVFVAEVID